jgi:hypothetical protein
LFLSALMGVAFLILSGCATTRRHRPSLTRPRAAQITGAASRSVPSGPIAHSSSPSIPLNLPKPTIPLAPAFVQAAERRPDARLKPMNGLENPATCQPFTNNPTRLTAQPHRDTVPPAGKGRFNFLALAFQFPMRWRFNVLCAGCDDGVGLPVRRARGVSFIRRQRQEGTCR